MDFYEGFTMKIFLSGLIFLTVYAASSQAAVLQDRYSKERSRLSSIETCQMGICYYDDPIVTEHDYNSVGLFSKNANESYADNGRVNFHSEYDIPRMYGSLSRETTLLAHFNVSEGEAYGFDFSSSVDSSLGYFPAFFQIYFTNKTTNQIVFSYDSASNYDATSHSASIEGILSAGQYEFFIRTGLPLEHWTSPMVTIEASGGAYEQGWIFGRIQGRSG
jgi:hypothetical protein